MGFLVLYITLYIIFTTCPHGLAFTEQLNNHIIDKRQYAMDELNDMLTTTKRKDVQIKIDFERFEVTPLPNFTDPHTFHLFNKTFFLMGSRIYDQISDEPTDLQHGYLIPNIDGNILLLRSMQFDDLGVILISFDTGVSHVYVLRNISEATPIQSLKHRTMLGDAKFFIMDNSIYLITTDREVFKDSTIVYKWLGNHFDEIDSTSIDDVIGLSTFNFVDHEFVVLLHNTQKQETIVTVYEFDGDRLKKVQMLKHNAGYRIFTYSFHEGIYLIIYGREDNFVYRWNRATAELVYHGQFQTPNPILQEVVETINGTQLIFLISNVSMQTYNSELKKLSQVDFEKPYMHICDAISITGHKKLYIYGNNGDELDLLTYYYVIRNISIDSKTEEHCLTSLQDKLEQQLGFYNNKNNAELVHAAYRSSSKEQVYKESSGNIPDLEPDYSPYDDNVSKIRIRMQNTTQRITDVMKKLSEVTKSDKVISNDVLVMGDLMAKLVSARNINFKQINDSTWEPSKWLSYTAAQNITGQITMPEITATKVKIPGLEGVMFKVGNTTITKSIQSKSLTSTNLFTKSINNIPFDDIYLKNKPTRVRGIKQFKNLITKNLTAMNLNGSKPGVLNINQFIFESEIKIKNLEVNTVDGINWHAFKTSLFQLDNSTRITGSVTLQKVKINNLNTKRINGLNIKDMMTTSTNQNIKSTMTFNNIETENITVTTVNGIHFKDNIVHISNSTSTIVNGPITIQKTNVLNTTFIHLDQEKMMYNNGHIIGTHQNDFLQRYSNKVKIAGNLHLKNLHLAKDSKIFLNKTEFENSDKYWMKNTDQHIPVDVSMQTLKTRNMSVESLNDIPIGNYMLNNNDDKLSTNYHFQNITILGNVNINDEAEHSPNLQELNDRIVTATTCQNIRGTKSFTGNITVNEADIIYLDSQDTNSVATINTEELSGKIIFDTITITGNLTAEKAEVNLINNTLIENLYDGMVLVENKINFNKLYIEHIYAANLIIKNLNGRQFDEYLKSLDKIYSIKEINAMTIKANGNINHLDNVYTINGVPYELIENAVSTGAIMSGTITFKDKVHIKNLTVKHMNNINIKDLVTKRLLQRNMKQTIPGRYRFKVLKTPHLVAKQVNEFNIETLVDVKKEAMQLMIGNFTINSSIFLGAISGHLLCDIKYIVKTLESPSTRTWNSVVISKNTTVLQKDNILSRIIDGTVRLDKNNTITSPVTFQSTPTAKTVNTKKDINNINITSILEDALLNREDHQLVTGYTLFSELSADDVIVDGDVNIPLVNSILIQDVDKSILRKDLIHNTTIKGQKLFYGGLHTKQLKTNRLSGLLPENLVNLDNLTQIPNVFFDTLHVQEDLHINYIENTNFYEFMNDRLLKSSNITQTVHGKVFFDNIQLNGPSIIPEINDIKLDDVVFDQGRQNISSPKHFTNNLVIHGDVQIDLINNFNLTEKYNRSVLLDRSIKIEDDMILEGVTSINGNVTVNKINGIPVEQIKQLINAEEPQVKTTEVDNIINQIQNIIKMNVLYLEDMPEEYMYLEKSQNLQVQIPNSISAQVVQTKDHIIMHVTSEESGDVCNLPNDCSCPVQYTLQIAPEPRLFPLKELQRIFSYDTDDITIHLITNSMSMSTQCRSNQTTLENEYVMLTWILKSNNGSETYTSSNFTTGYISGVKFFSWDNEVYMVVCIFYDPHVDTHNSNCMVFKFANDGTKIDHVQSLPSKGAWTLHLFESPYQGYTLIIGNIYDSDEVLSGTSTDIYYFNKRALRFIHIKKIVGHGAISVTDAVIGEEVHIILAQKDSPLLIFNFDVMHRNYFLCQSINFDSPITSVSTFYIGSRNSPDAFISVVTDTGRFAVYGYKHIEGWKLKSKSTIDGLRSLIPFSFQRQSYLFAPSAYVSSLLTVKKHSSN